MARIPSALALSELCAVFERNVADGIQIQFLGANPDNEQRGEAQKSVPVGHAGTAAQLGLFSEATAQSVHICGTFIGRDYTENLAILFLVTKSVYAIFPIQDPLLFLCVREMESYSDRLSSPVVYGLSTLLAKTIQASS
ncbi:hypothetical protein SISNIDRAFT_487102 [Sistotremastrum niveocremeum HHB9708]|uniref:Uncharacterized protein n=1 Tax=Sistotremastrum niveocremeum HHB9708 TaxID=1314777 RepID=A0A164ST81_9AGAM|nr:hypothetical protein SISNIDRAFT_487102 [Sistotremastrum niveocremeum HHB9708]